MPRKISVREQVRLEKDAEIVANLIREQTLAEMYGKSLKAFLKAAWPVLDPASPFVDSWHIDCFCEHLEALARREIRRLILNVPPRSAKSTVCSVLFPAWRWINAPEEKFLCASYGKGLALRDSRRTRNLIKSQWYQARWGAKFGLAEDQNEKGRFDNTQGGFRMIASVEGGVLGEGGSFTIYDDPNDLRKMIDEPDTYPQTVREWYSGTASSRFIDPKTDVRLCIQQRSSFGGDLTEYLLELGGWEQLAIPNEFDGRKTVTSLGWTDPRIHVGELMNPARLGPEETAQLKIEQRQHYPGQYQQSPMIAGTEALKREWFRFYNPPGVERVDQSGNPIPVRITSSGKTVEIVPVQLPPAFEQLVASWDMAFKDLASNDFVAGHVWGRTGANTYLLARDHGHKNFPASVQAVRKLSVQFPCPEKLVEDKANGPAVIATLQNEIPGLIAVDPAGGKWSRVAAVSGYVEAGNVFLPNPDIYPWVWELLSEFSAGRSAKHDDDTDAMTQALKRLYDGMARTGVPEFRVEPRLGEPATASHVMPMVDKPDPQWRRFIAIVPGRAALWMAETQTGSLRVLREFDMERVDAAQAGREIARHTVGELARVSSAKKGQFERAYELFLPKEAFAAVEPVGSYAEMLEQSILSWEPEDGSWDARQEAREAVRAARFRSEMVEERDASIDRLRDLLAFAPPDFAEVPYDRRKALKLADEDMRAYLDYMAAVDGEVRGEWPKIKIHQSCTALIAQLGTFRTDLDPPAFVETLLLGVSVPKVFKKGEVIEIPANRVALLQKHKSPSTARGRMISRRFAMR